MDAAESHQEQENWCRLWQLMRHDWEIGWNGQLNATKIEEFSRIRMIFGGLVWAGPTLATVGRANRDESIFWQAPCHIFSLFLC